jgi:hypothetical protein
MPTFDTPGPISVDIDITLGNVRVVATDCTDCTVEVRPSNPVRGADVKDAEQTLVEFNNGTLLARTPKRFSLFGRGGSVDLMLSVPSGSAVEVDAAIADLRFAGQVGRRRIKLAME